MEGIYTKKGTKLSAHILTTQRESLNLMIFFLQECGVHISFVLFHFYFSPSSPYVCFYLFSLFCVMNGIPNETVTPDQLITRRNVCLFISLFFHFIICVCYKKDCRALSCLWILVVWRSILRTCAS